MEANSSFSPNSMSGRGGQTIRCPPFPNVRFETLDSPLPYFLNAALNVSLAVATTVANLAVLFAIRHVTSIRLPSRLLLCSLVLTDLGAGSVVQPQFAAFLFHRAVYPDLVPCALTRSIAFTGSAFATSSLLTIGAISLDRYAALFFYLRYRQIVTTRRVCAALAFVWVLAVFFVLASLLNRELWQTAVATGAAVTLVVISVAYIKIYSRLRAERSQPQEERAGNTLDMARYRRTASAMMWVYVLLLICYLPLLCTTTFRSALKRMDLTEYLYEFSCSLVLLNSFLNPFVYCLRLPEIRTEVVKQLRRLFCRSNSTQWTKLSFETWVHSPGQYHAGEVLDLGIN